MHGTTPTERRVFVYCKPTFTGCISTQSVYPLLPPPPTQLQYKDTLQEGAALHVPLPHTEGVAIDLQVGVVIETALKVLQPTQTNSSSSGNGNGSAAAELFYRQQAWAVIQVSQSLHSGVSIYVYTVLFRISAHFVQTPTVNAKFLLLWANTINFARLGHAKSFL